MEIWERLAFGRPLLLILFPLGALLFVWLCHRPKRRPPMGVWAFLAAPHEGGEALGRRHFDGLSFASLCLGWLAFVLLVSGLGWRSPPRALAIGLDQEQLRELQRRFPDWSWLPSARAQPWRLPKVLDGERDLLVSRWQRRDWKGAVWNPDLESGGGVEVDLIPVMNELIVGGADEIAGEKQPRLGQAEPVRVSSAEDHYGRVLELGRQGRPLRFSVPPLDHGLELEHSAFPALPQTLLRAVAGHRTDQPRALALVMAGSSRLEAQTWCFYGPNRVELEPLPPGLPYSIQLSAQLPRAAHFGGLDWPFDGETSHCFRLNPGRFLVGRAGRPLVQQSLAKQMDFAWSKPPLLSKMAYSLLLELSFPRPPLHCLAQVGAKDPPHRDANLTAPQQPSLGLLLAWLLMILSWSFALARAFRPPLLRR
jgi:hypothetical protein